MTFSLLEKRLTVRIRKRIGLNQSSDSTLDLNSCHGLK